MKNERPIELDALVPVLHQFFDDILPNLARNQQDEIDFLSRALAAFSIYKLAGASIEKAAEAVVDGGHDGGIDAIYIDEPAAKIWLVQSKFIQNGLDVPDLAETTRFVNGAEALQAQQFDEMAKNAAIAAKIPEIERMLRQPGTIVSAVLCYSGIRTLSDDRARLFESSRARHQLMGDDYLVYEVANLSRLASWLQDDGLDDGVDIEEFLLISPGGITTPHIVVYGLVSLETLAALYREHDQRLLAKNLWGYKGSTEVNDVIEKSAREEPALFSHFNNGLTAYCDSLRPIAADAANQNQKRFRIRGLRLINGAQTIGSITRACDTIVADGKAPIEGHALIKIISLENVENDTDHATKISRAANFQNAVTTRDFASVYPLHQAWKDTLNLVGVGYHFRLDDQTPDPGDNDFTIEEALTAMASVNNDNSCALVTRIAANRDSLRSLDPINEIGNLQDHWHGRVFPAISSARTLWRSVQVQRVFTDCIRDQQRASTGVVKEFWNHGRWVILAAIFAKLQPHLQSQETTLTEAERATVSGVVAEYGELLLKIASDQGYARYEAMGGQMVLKSDRSFQSVFKTQADCRRLFGLLKAELFSPPAVPLEVDKNSHD